MDLIVNQIVCKYLINYKDQNLNNKIVLYTFFILYFTLIFYVYSYDVLI